VENKERWMSKMLKIISLLDHQRSANTACYNKSLVENCLKWIHSFFSMLQRNFQLMRGYIRHMNKYLQIMLQDYHHM